MQGLLDSNQVPLSSHAAEVIAALTADGTWNQCPERIAKLVARLHLIHHAGNPVVPATATDMALARLLREQRTQWIQLPDDELGRLVTLGLDSPNWLARREAEAIHRRTRTDPAGGAAATFNPRERYRRLRGGRAIQVALDLHDLDRAVEVAVAAAQAGVDFIEVGDPLIKAAGVGAVERIKRQVSDVLVVAEMMSADWGQDQVELAVEAGADVVFLIGPATVMSVSAAVHAGRRLGAPILLDVPSAQTTQSWVQEMERAGVDGFSVTTNIDQGVRGQQPLGKAQAVRSWTRLPVAVSGGFSTRDQPIINSTDWDIIVIGRSIAEAVDPARAAKHMVRMIQGQEDNR